METPRFVQIACTGTGAGGHSYGDGENYLYGLTAQGEVYYWMPEFVKDADGDLQTRRRWVRLANPD